VNVFQGISNQSASFYFQGSKLCSSSWAAVVLWPTYFWSFKCDD